MEIDIVSVLILVLFAGLGGVAGYWTRIAQKIEEKRDETYLTNLPSIYSNLTALNDSLALYCEGGKIDEFVTNLDKASENLRKTIFSANILVFRERLHDNLYDFYQETQNLEAVVKDVKDSPNRSEEEQKFRRVYKDGGEYHIGTLTANPKNVSTHVANIREAIKKELKGYSSVSFKLTIAIFALGALVAAIEILKGLFEA